jgi:hypothetical protein
MSKKAISPILAALSEVMNKLTRQEEILLTSATNKLPALAEQPAAAAEVGETLTPATDLHRIAGALERIANALEKLTAEAAESSAEIKQNDEQWITLPNTPIVPDEASKKAETKKSAELIPPVAPLASKPLADSAASNSLKLAVPVPNATNNNILLTYLTKRGITVQQPKQKATPEEQAYQVRLEKIALHLGENFTVCQELYKELKENLIPPCSPFDYTTKGKITSQNSILRKLCHLLKEAGLLEIYTCKGVSNQLTFKLKASGKERNYIEGLWLESYLKQEVERIIRPYANSTQQCYEALPNLYITFKDGSKTELDLLFALGKKVFCVEAKMQPDLSELQGYLKKVKNLGLSNNAILIVVADKSEEECLKLSQGLGGVKVACLNNFEETLKSMLDSVVI